MKVDDLFKAKPRPKQNRSGAATKLEKAALEEFRQTFGPVAAKAKQYFEAPCINGKKRYWLLPTEDYDDLPIDKIQYVLKYKQWFLNEVSKIELDDIPYEYPTHSNNEAAKPVDQQATGMGASHCGGSCSR